MLFPTSAARPLRCFVSSYVRSCSHLLPRAVVQSRLSKMTENFYIYIHGAPRRISGQVYRLRAAAPIDRELLRRRLRYANLFGTHPFLCLRATVVTLAFFFLPCFHYNHGALRESVGGAVGGRARLAMILRRWSRAGQRTYAYEAASALPGSIPGGGRAESVFGRIFPPWGWWVSCRTTTRAEGSGGGCC